MTPIRRYKARVPGPELRIEDAVAGSLDTLTPSTKKQRRVALASLPIGAGAPDLTVVSFRPELGRAPSDRGDLASVLAYLRSVNAARAATISSRLGRRSTKVESDIEILLDVGAVEERQGAFALAPLWRDILVDVVAVEAKVEHWRRALDQAMRNLLFCHRTFIALPTTVARRASGEPTLRQHGVGVIGVGSDGSTVTVRRARRQLPRAWYYYYTLALHLAAE